jgi:hypothetical protein
LDEIRVLRHLAMNSGHEIRVFANLTICSHIKILRR